MHKLVILDKPSDHDLVVPYSQKGQKKEVLVLIYGNKKGKYKICLVGDHTVPETSGKMVIKAVAKNGAKLEITGKIRVNKKAVGTNSFLEIRVVLLDQESWAMVEPILEVEARDVKVGHAATVGSVDQDQLFYLMSRGMDKTEAEELIVRGFLGDSNKVPESQIP